jgi:hypothetical protein
LRLGPGGATAIWLGFDKPTVIAPEPRLKSLLDEFVSQRARSHCSFDPVPELAHEKYALRIIDRIQPHAHK